MKITCPVCGDAVYSYRRASARCTCGWTYEFHPTWRTGRQATPMPRVPEKGPIREYPGISQRLWRYFTYLDMGRLEEYHNRRRRRWKTTKI